MEGIASDKVNINVGGGEGRGGYDGGASIAAVIAALGNRNQGNDNAALVAALMNNRDRDRDDGLGGGVAGLVALMALLNRRGFGDGGDCGGDRDWGGRDRDGGLSPGQAAALQTLMEGQSSLRAEGPENTLRAQGEILQAISELALADQAGFANVKDSVQAGLLATLAATSGVKDSVMNNSALLQRDLATVNQNVSAQGCQTRETVLASENRIIAKLDQNTIDDLRHRAERAERAVEVNALASRVEVNQTVTTTQAQAQAQGQIQAQFQDIGNVLRRVCDRLDAVHQVAQAANSNIIAGNTGAVVTGPQNNNPTNVNSRNN